MIAMYVIALLVVYVLLGVFAVQNGGTQTFTLLGYSWDLPTWVPTAAAAAVVSVLLILQMSATDLGYRMRLFGHSRAIDEHRGLIANLRDENARLREQLAAARGASSGTVAAARASWRDSVRSLGGRFANR